MSSYVKSYRIHLKDTQPLFRLSGAAWSAHQHTPAIIVITSAMENFPSAIINAHVMTRPFYHFFT